MNDFVDFHIHSSWSCDGDHSPEELVRFAREKGFRAISIADHDTVSAYPAVIEDGRRDGIEIIPGIEVTTLYGEREFHLLLPFVDWGSEALASIISRMTESRMAEARERVEKLRNAGVELTWDEVWEKSRSCPPLGVKIAQILLEKPESGKDPALGKYYEEENKLFGPYIFYRDYFMEGKPAYVPKKHIPLLEVLAAAPRTGGVPVLSHPGAYFQNTTREDLRALKERGLAGLEVYTFYHTPEQVASYKRMAVEFDLVPTAGSDFHGKIKPHVAFGALKEGRYWMVEELRKRRPQ
ncbi:MAG: PHP domain-containing protein [Candidatus Aminicenantales bacterium]